MVVVSSSGWAAPRLPHPYCPLVSLGRLASCQMQGQRDTLAPVQTRPIWARAWPLHQLDSGIIIITSSKINRHNKFVNLLKTYYLCMENNKKVIYDNLEAENTGITSADCDIIRVITPDYQRTEQDSYTR